MRAKVQLHLFVTSSNEKRFLISHLYLCLILPVLCFGLKNDFCFCFRPQFSHQNWGVFFYISSSIVIFQIRKKFHKQNSGLVIFLYIFSGEVELKNIYIKGKEEKQGEKKVLITANSIYSRSHFYFEMN